MTSPAHLDFGAIDRMIETFPQPEIRRDVGLIVLGQLAIWRAREEEWARLEAKIVADPRSGAGPLAEAWVEARNHRMACHSAVVELRKRVDRLAARS